MTTTAWVDGHRKLYHWEKFNPVYLRSLIRERKIYCSNPADFNDPRDCKPNFSVDVLDDPIERQAHAKWASYCQMLCMNPKLHSV